MLDNIIALDESCNNAELEENISCKLYIVGSLIKEGTKKTYKEAQTHEILIDNDGREFLIQSAKRTLSYLKERDFYEINEVEEPGESFISYIAVPHLSDLDRWQKPQTFTNVRSAHTVLNRDDFKPKAYMCEINIGDQRFLLLKSISESALLKRHSTFFKLGERGAYELDKDPNRRLYHDENWDALTNEGFVALINEKKVLEMFKYYERVKEAAQDTLDRLGDLDLISDLGSFEEFIDNRVMLQKKLARASTHPFDDESKQRIIELIQNGTIDLQLNRDNKIVCTTPQEMKIVLEVMLDTYMESLITKGKYKALNKTKM